MKPAVRILAVEDDPDLGGVLIDLLEAEGYVLDLATSAREARSKLAQQPYALVLADLMTEDGGDPLEQMARLVRAASPAPVGLVTGWKQGAEQCTQLGCQFALLKPFEVEQLFEQVGRHTQLREVSDAERRCITSYFEALSTRQWDVLATLATERIIYNLPGDTPGFSQRLEGRAAFRDYARTVFAQFPDARFTVHTLTALPTAVIASYSVSWATDGSRAETTGAVMFRFDGELIREVGIRTEASRLLAGAQRV